LGRTTPSLRASVEDYAKRMRRVADMLPLEDRVLVEKYLEDIELTISAYTHTGLVDPLEVFIVHLVRRLRELCCTAQSR
jgi:hypothetical protein